MTGYMLIENEEFCCLAAERTVIWKKPASGSKFAPYVDPEAHIDLVRFCSDWDYYTVRSRQTVSLTHQAVPGAISYDSRGWGGGTIIRLGNVWVQEQVLFEHNAGYVPRFSVAQNGKVLPAGMNVQDLGNRARLVSFCATNTQIICRNVGISSNVDLPAIAVDYDLVVYKRPTEVPIGPALPNFWAKVSRAIFGRGKLDTATTTMRTGSGADTPFWISKGRTVDFNTGRSRVVVPNGPTITQTGYAGGFTGSPYLRMFI